MLDADQLRRFLLGQLDEPEHQRIEQLVAESPECLAEAEAAAAPDALLESLRAVGDTTDLSLPSSTKEFVARLERRFQITADTEPPRVTCNENTPPSSPLAEYAFLEPPDRPGCLGRLGGYRIVKKLGEGGMGFVFLAEDPVANRRVAIKVMRPEIASRPGARERFLREARAAAALEHEHVIPLYHVEASGAVPFLVMPFLAGETLADRLGRDGALPIAEVLRIGRETARGLAAAHTAGLIHRDIKPGNIWLYDPPHADSTAPRGQVKILDFGLVRSLTDNDTALSRPGALLGTPAYMAPEQADMAPEQAAGKSVDARADLFSLGCVLYQAATGQPPFRGKTLLALLSSLANDQPIPPHVVRPEVPQPLSDLIMKLLAKSPNDRPASAREVADALHAIERNAPMPDTVASTISETLPVAAGWHGLLARAKRPKPRWRASILAAALLAAVALGSWLLFRPTANPNQVTIPSAYRGQVDALIWKKDAAGLPRKMRLNDAGALPVHSGDQVRMGAIPRMRANIAVFCVFPEQLVGK